MTYTLEGTSSKMLTFCLAFANTAAWHASPHPEEGITTLKDLIDWEEAKGILSQGQAVALRLAAEKDSTGAEGARLAAIEFRESVYRVFAAVAWQKEPAAVDIARINEVLQWGISKAALIESGGHFSWVWAGEKFGYDCLLWPAAHSAARLLTDEKLRTSIRQCADDRGCGVLFLDRTRNHSRRWCSMKSCGNRAKAQRHYQKLQNATMD
jgi:predicted RNA-binding Zn ribbon-like protein